MITKSIVNEYLDKIGESLDKLRPFLAGQIEEIAKLLLNASEKKRTVFLMGNGGSGATASHLACDLAKGTIITGRPRLRVVALTDSMPQILAWANDQSYEDIFVEQLKNLMVPGDVVIGISGSGSSPNVVKGLEYARENNAITIAWTGFKGGKVKDIAQICIIVPSDSMQRIEDIHLLIGHLLMHAIRKEIETQ